MATMNNEFLTSAKEEGADLLVTGAYGLTPWREGLIGGARHDLVDSCPLPILIMQ
jgi:nucleotide-binding universal stress UspA family protein